MHSGERWRLGRRPALDGLRGFAFLLVLAAHYVPGGRFAAGGPIGVTVFFVLSGFLITSLLLEEHSRTGRVSLPAFYGRRARRLFPALAVLLGVVAVFDLMVGQPVRAFLPVIFYAGNWFRVAGAYLPLGLDHTWSLAVEEQFYLLWPLVLLAALVRGRARAVFWLAAVGAAGSVALRVLLFPEGARHAVFGSDTNAFGLLAGCALAAWMSTRPAGGRNRPGVAVVLVGGLAVAGAGSSTVESALVGPLAAAAVACAVIWLLCREGGVGLLGHRVLRFVGRRSYGYYLWHLPMRVVFDMVGGNVLVGRLAAVVLTVVVAELSWRYVERPFLGQATRPQVPVMAGGGGGTLRAA